LAGKATFATKITGFEECDHRFLSLVGYDAELHLSVLDVKDGVGWGALGKDELPLAIGRGGHSAIKRRHESAGIKWLLCLLFAHRDTCLPAERGHWVAGGLQPNSGFLLRPGRASLTSRRAEITGPEPISRRRSRYTTSIAAIAVLDEVLREFAIKEPTRVKDVFVGRETRTGSMEPTGGERD
jgi:hypothetical protein